MRRVLVCVICTAQGRSLKDSAQKDAAKEKEKAAKKPKPKITCA